MVKTLRKYLAGTCILCCLSTAAAAPGLFPSASQERTVRAFGKYESPLTYIERYQSVRFMAVVEGLGLTEGEISALLFNRLTRWNDANRAIAEKVLAMGARKGLGVEALHARGITGKGVSVAIIDDLLCLDHPEFSGRIVELGSFGYEAETGEGSFHGPAVASLLAGSNLGTAPEATVYYCAAAAEEGDSLHYAEALERIIEVNRTLDGAAKIRLVSVSAAPSGPSSPFEKNLESWDDAVRKAALEGILVMDCTEDNGFVYPGYCDYQNPDDFEAFLPGFPGKKSRPMLRYGVYAPCSRRTIAEEYYPGEFSYTYAGKGGLSWGIPYAAGVCALAWQVNPRISAERMREMLIETAYVTKNGVRVINPAALVELAGKAD